VSRLESHFVAALTGTLLNRARQQAESGNAQKTNFNPNWIGRDIVTRGEFNISGFHNQRLRAFLPQLNSGQVSRLLKRALLPPRFPPQEKKRFHERTLEELLQERAVANPIVAG
jgi:hypothetical protein